MTAFATATTTAAAPRRTRSRAANVALWTLQVLLAAVYAFSAFGKLSADAQNVAGFQAMGLGNAGMYIIGALELAGAIAMFIPRLTGLAATCFVALMIGAVVCLPFTPGLVREVAAAPVSATGWLVYLGVVPTALAFSTWAYALARMDAGRLGVSTYAVPPITIAQDRNVTCSGGSLRTVGFCASTPTA